MPEQRCVRVALALGVRVRGGQDRPPWRHRERVRWQALGRGERSWDEKNETGGASWFELKLMTEKREAERREWRNEPV